MWVIGHWTKNCLQLVVSLTMEQSFKHRPGKCVIVHASVSFRSFEPFNRWGVKDHFHVAVGSTALASGVASVVPPSGASSLRDGPLARRSRATYTYTYTYWKFQIFKSHLHAFSKSFKNRLPGFPKIRFFKNVSTCSYVFESIFRILK